MAKEEWKPVKGYEGLYEVSSFGRVRSLNRVIIASTSNSPWYKRVSRGKVLAGGMNGSGYLFVYLGKNGIINRYYIHRLVAIAFIPNPNNYPIINHKDENRANNCVSNLEWCTPKYNANYGGHIQRVRDFMLSDKNPNRGKPRQENFKKKVRKPVLQFSLGGELIKEWDSAKTAGITLGIFPSSITAVCKNKYRSYKSYIWRYKHDYSHSPTTKKT